MMLVLPPREILLFVAKLFSWCSRFVTCVTHNEDMSRVGRRPRRRGEIMNQQNTIGWARMKKVVAAAAIAGALALTTAVPAFAMHPITFGTSGPDDLRGTSASDDLRGLGGNDYLRGRGAVDILRGGSGSDYVDGQGGNDYIYGGSGDDEQTTVGPTAKGLYGGPGDDVIYGGAGDDTLVGGTGVDQLTGGTDDDWIFAKDDGLADRIDCGDGNDVVWIDKGLDKVAGNCERINPRNEQF
jgi:Ca2+-binding RTX toxin-like protein